MNEPAKSDARTEEVKAELEFPGDITAELKNFVESVGGIERAIQLMDDLENEDVDESSRDAA